MFSEKMFQSFRCSDQLFVPYPVQCLLPDKFKEIIEDEIKKEIVDDEIEKEFVDGEIEKQIIDDNVAEEIVILYFKDHVTR